MSLLMLGCLMGFSLGIDIFQGFDISQTLSNAVSQFRVIEISELFVFFYFFFCRSCVSSYKEEKSKQVNTYL
jgi:hypothetical protein